MRATTNVPVQPPGAEPEPPRWAASDSPARPAGQGPTVSVLAIDPGPVESAYTWIDEVRRPVRFEKLPNAEVIDALRTQTIAWSPDVVAVEMVASYGMPVGREVFETCVWIGRFIQIIGDTRREPRLVYRRDVKLHHCHSSKATDATVRQALVDRFASGQPNHGKGTKATQGWFYGFKADVWQAYALAVYVADTAHAAPTEGGV